MKTALSPDIFINHKLSGAPTRHPLTLLDRWHLIRCYGPTAAFGLIASLFVPLIAAAAKFRAEGRSGITTLAVQGWAIDRQMCWYVAAILGVASLLKVFQLVREQFPGRVGLITTAILCVGAEQQWIIFRPTRDLDAAHLFDFAVTIGVFLFVLLSNAFAGASNLALQQRRSELACLLTLDDNSVTRAALLQARDDAYRMYFEALEDALRESAAANGKSSLKVFRVIADDVETHWLGPNGAALAIQLKDPNATEGRPKLDLADAKSSQSHRVAVPISNTLVGRVSPRAPTGEGEDPHRNGRESTGPLPAAPATVVRSTRNRG